MSNTQSVLDSMTSGIMDRKAAKGERAGLTPVPGESAARIPDIREVFLTNEAVVDVAKDLRAQAALLVQVADGLDRLTGTAAEVPTAAQVQQSARVEQRIMEQKADERVATLRENDTPPPNQYPDYAQLQREAQNAVFAPPATVGSAAEGWVCPVHGGMATEQKVSKKNRPYRVCTKCPEFER